MEVSTVMYYKINRIDYPILYKSDYIYYLYPTNVMYR